MVIFSLPAVVWGFLTAFFLAGFFFAAFLRAGAFLFVVFFFVTLRFVAARLVALRFVGRRFAVVFFFVAFLFAGLRAAVFLRLAGFFFFLKDLAMICVPWLMGVKKIIVDNISLGRF